MAQPEDHSLDYRFELLTRLDDAEELDKHYRHLLHLGPAILDPLAEYLIRQPNEPRIAVLLNLLGKLGDQRAVPLLMRFLDIQVSELRIAATVGLAWLRAPVAIEKLDDMVGKDPDPRVRAEAANALDEILDEFPALATLLHHHKMSDEMEPESPADTKQRADPRLLIRTMPRILAHRYWAVPLRFTERGRLVVAVREGTDDALREVLEALLGLELEMKEWKDQSVHAAFEKLYASGDDDFCEHVVELRSRVREELVQVILEGVLPDKPISPLDEATEGVEAAQEFLGFCASGNGGLAIVEHKPEGELRVVVHCDHNELSLAPPPREVREPFITVLHMISGLSPDSEDAATSTVEGRGGRVRFDFKLARTQPDKLLRLEIKGHKGPTESKA